MRVSHLLIATGVAWCWSSASVATTLRKASFDELCARADVVFVGSVASIETRRNSGSDLIYTDTTFEVDEWIVGGDGQNSYTLATLGGSVGDDTLLVHGMPRFEIGGRYILFIRRERPSICPVVGWHQGCFRVEQDAGDAEPVVRMYDRRRIAGVARGGLLAERPSPNLGKDGAPATERPSTGQTKEAPRMTLDRFIVEIRGGIARAADRANSGGTP